MVRQHESQSQPNSKGLTVAYKPEFKTRLLGTHTDNDCGGEVYYTSSPSRGVRHCKKCKMSSHDPCKPQAPNYEPMPEELVDEQTQGWIDVIRSTR